ncbi:MAG: tyrosine--tRNA ligase [Acidimicrobiales bacterium]
MSERRTGQPGLFEELHWRGLVHQVTDAEALPRLLDQDRLTGYIGFDPSADSLHVGHLQQVFLLRRLQQAGHQAIALIGGGTGMIGDPSFKSDERRLLDVGTIEANRAAVRAQLSRLVEPAPAAPGTGGVVLADNLDWLAGAGLLEFLRDVGKAFSVNEMVRKDSVRARLEGREQGLSFTEFSYMLLQAWDFVQLFDRYGCRLQMGGSDQWGNIIEGVDLIRRMRRAQAFGLTSPLVLKADGSKFGKTESATVWLASERTSPYSFFQFWLRSADSDVGSYLRRFTWLERDRIAELEELTANAPERREAQRALATEVTTIVHGADHATAAERAAEVLFTEDVAGLDAATLASALADAPTTELPGSELSGGVSLVDALVRCGLASSNGAARRDLAGGGISVNGRRATVERQLGPDDVLAGGFVIVRKGRANQHVLRIRR